MKNLSLTRRSFIKSVGYLTGSSLAYQSNFVLGDMDTRDRLTIFLEEIPQDRIIEQTVQHIKQGVRNEDLLAALTSASVQNVQPYPGVGFKYHNVMVLQSLHLATDALVPSQQSLPLLWGINFFKESQYTEQQRTGWRMSPVHTLSMTRERARQVFIAMLESWNAEEADTAVVQLLQATNPSETMAVLLPYLARDYREIGHKCVTAANALRMLQINNNYAAEAILRSTVAAALNSGRDDNPAENDYKADRAWRQNQELVDQIPSGWEQGRIDWPAGKALLEVMRYTNDLEAGQEVARLLQKGIAPEVIWEALVGAAGEMMFRSESFVALHANTMVNALHYMYRHATDQATRKLLLLQTAAQLALIRVDCGYSYRRVKIEELQPLASDDVDECFAAMANGRFKASRMVLGWLNTAKDESVFLDRVRLYTVQYVDNSHDYKYAEAVLEEYSLMSAPWRKQYLSSAMMALNGPHNRRNGLMQEVQEMLKG